MSGVDDNIPATGPVIICSQHVAASDPFLIKFMIMWVHPKRKVYGLGKVELFRNPFIAWYMRHMRVIPLDRSRTADLTAGKEAIQVLKNGDILGVFPQGTRHGKSIEGGVFSYAKKSYVQPSGEKLTPQIVVVSIEYTQGYFPRPVHIVFHPPCTSKNFASESEFHTHLRALWKMN